VAERKALLIRVDPRVHEALERWARDELRSVNAQIEFVVRRALQQAGRLKAPAEGAQRADRHDAQEEP
jgi:hypothetical protein